MSLIITPLLALTSFLPTGLPQQPPQRNPTPRQQPQPRPTPNPATRNKPEPTDPRHGRGTRRGFPEEEESSPNAPREPKKDPKATPEEEASPSVPMPPEPRFTTEDPEAYGAEILDYLLAFDSGWLNESGSGTMFHEGEERWRASFVWKANERLERGNQRLLRIGAGDEEKSGGVLVQGRPRFPASIWYRGETDGLRRLEAADKSQPVLGSLLTCEDLAPIETNRFAWRFLGEAALSRDGHGVSCRRVEARRKVGDAGERRVYWISSENWRLERLEVFRGGDRAQRVFDFMSWHSVHGRFWRPWRWVIREPENGVRTILAFGRLRLLDESDGAPDRRALSPTELVGD